MTRADDVITYGLAEIGKPYVYGAEGPNKFDCSGLMQFIFAKVGVKLPRTADQQYRYTKPVASPLPGDLVFWVDGSGHASHVALYLGGGQVLAAPHTGADVQEEGLFEEQGHTRHYGRVPGIGTAAAAVIAPVAAVVAPVAGWTSAAVDKVLGGARGVVLEAVAAAAGIVLVGLGAYRLAAPKIREQQQKLESAL